MSETNYMLETRDLEKTFKTGTVVTPVLKGIDFHVANGEWVSIMGRSGAGKSTLLYQMSLLDEPTSGEIYIDGREAHTLTEREKMRMRLYEFGFVFQEYALMPELTALENVVLPLLMKRFSYDAARERAKSALGRVGLSARLGNLPSALSGGEQQRVSIARAIAERPEILFADEPTANLDHESSDVIMGIFRELHSDGQTIVMVTHEEEYGAMTERIVRIDDGRVLSGEPASDKRP
ncbi:MAG: ABC transporter ATP-binding protein [Patescibacteria group bacterium]|nr:ABC transporter ATP-binding protein [Patescibacteria group bacterium]